MSRFRVEEFSMVPLLLDGAELEGLLSGFVGIGVALSSLFAKGGFQTGWSPNLLFLPPVLNCFSTLDCLMNQILHLHVVV